MDKGRRNMGTTLSRRAVRDGSLPRPRADVPGFLESLGDLSSGSLVLDRREAIGLSAVAALGTTRVATALADDVTPCAVEATPARIAVSAGGKRLVLDASIFGGNTRFEIQTAGSTVVVKLTGARYAGTDLPAGADLTFIDVGTTVARVRIRLEFGGFEAEASVRDWLSGKVVARSPVKLDGLSTTLDRRFGLRFQGSATAALAGDWSMTLEGARVATVTRSGRSFQSDKTTLWLPAIGDTTTLTRRLKRRTLVRLERGTYAWDVPAPRPSAEGTVRFDSGAFDGLTVEMAETAEGSRLGAVVFTQSGAASMTRFVPAKVRGKTNATSAIPLCNVRYAMAVGDGDRFAIGADFSRSAAWLHSSGMSLLVGNGGGGSVFTASGTALRMEGVECKPALLGVSVPMSDAVTSPIMFPSEAKQVRLSAASLSAESRGIQALVSASAVSVVRPDDLLALKFEFFNMDLVPSGGTSVLKRQAGKTAYVVVELPPQHVLEEALLEESALGVLSAFKTLFAQADGTASKAPPLSGLISGPTRLAFKVSNQRADAGIPYSLAGLLDWTGFTHSVAPAASSASVPSPVAVHAPQKGDSSQTPETYIEAPWGLYMSPVEDASWKHRATPMKSGSTVGLWHTRLRGPKVGSDYGPITLRAIWARRYGTADNALNVSGAFRNSLSTADLQNFDLVGFKNRFAIVDLSGVYRHNAVEAKEMMLSPLGATFDVGGRWDDVSSYMGSGEKISTAVSRWDHRAIGGRDHFVRIDKLGRLFPWGHKATLITITKREFRASPSDGQKTAYLIQRQYVVVREPVMSYTLADFKNNPRLARQTPFKRVELKTLQTPPFTGESIANGAFWMKVNGKKFQFDVEADDWDGNKVTIRQALAFVGEEYATSPNYSISLAGMRAQGWPSKDDVSNTLGKLAEVVIPETVDAWHQMVTYAEKSAPDPKKDARGFKTAWMKWTADYSQVKDIANLPPGQLLFTPVLFQAGGKIEEMAQLAKQEAETVVKLSKQYTDFGYELANKAGKVILELDNELGLDMGGEAGGAIASVTGTIKGIGAEVGAFAGEIEDFAKGVFDPSKYFGDDAELLAGIKLKDILKTLDDTAKGIENLAKIPGFTARINRDMRNMEYTLVITYEWSTEEIVGWGPFQPDTGCKLALKSEASRSLSRRDAKLNTLVHGELTSFSLGLPTAADPWILLKFKSLVFHSETGKKTKLEPKIDDVVFGGMLEFINDLRRFMISGNGNSFSVNVAPTAISVKFSRAVPDIAIGVFSLKNMSLGCGLSIPFTNNPLTFEFNFCSRERPFELGVSGWAGGGYVMCKLNAKTGVELVEVSFEFGASTTFSLAGLATGQVEIKGGLILKIETVEGVRKLSLKAYIRIGGSLKVLGLITVSVTFVLALEAETYDKPGGGGSAIKLYGEATLTVEIDLCFFSKSVKLSVKRELAGSDPRFGETIEAGDWSLYCKAFAPVKKRG
jgi:hypothetical protein